ncbi:MAG: ribonuclease H-like domain-containing protein [Butyrivibrio sp.]|nr:ribonuclease H-like domain-containing protein [Butyrivibrio sp.]
MKIISEDVTPNKEILEYYPLEKLSANKEDILFIDIETTGLSAKTSKLYLIGLAYYEWDLWHIVQFFADTDNSEKEVLKAALLFIMEHNFKVLVHYNGNRFDLPYIRFKCDKYGYSNVLDELESIDIYKQISKYKDVLGIPDCKQKTIELFLGIDRRDEYSGKELIDIYKKYLSGNSSELYNFLVLHNSDDLKGMFSLLPILRYPEVIKSLESSNLTEISLSDENISIPDIHLPVKASKVQANYYTDIDGNRRIELYMKMTLNTSLPSNIGGSADNCYFQIDKNIVTVRIPLLEDELKYFYSNYKDYYYLPAEDTAMHKSIAEFVDKAHREKATKANCYTKKPGQYLPQWTLLFKPYFKKSYEDNEFFFELTENFKTNRKAMSLYGAYIINHIINNL